MNAGTVISESTDVEIVKESKSAPHSLASSSVPTIEKQTNKPLVVWNINSVNDCKEELWTQIQYRFNACVRTPLTKHSNFIECVF